MKKYIFAVLCVPSLWYVNAQTIPLDTSTQGTSSVITSNESLTTEKPACLDLQYTLRLRSKDSDTKGEVLLLQKFLNDEGLLGVYKNGYFDSPTQKALKAFQRQNGIFTSGLSEKYTRKAIKERSCSRQVRPTFKPLVILPQEKTAVASSSGSVSILESYHPIVSSDQNLGTFVIYADDVVEGAGSPVTLGIAMGNCKNAEKFYQGKKRVRCLWKDKEIYVPTGLEKASSSVLALDKQAPKNTSPSNIEKQNINSLSGVPSVLTATSSIFVDEAGVGVYQGFLNGSLFIRTEKITKKDAYDNCQLNHSTNPMKSILCTWDGKEIYSSVKISSGVTVQGVPFTVTKESNRDNDQIKHDRVIVSQEQAAVSSWKKINFLTYNDEKFCSGERYVGYSKKYGLYVGAELCDSAKTYKLYMSDSENGTYFQIADLGGHGQDHCELINATFTLPNEDEITSGSCSSCSLGEMYDVQYEPVFSRARFGDAFKKIQSTYWSDLTSKSYSCGVPIGVGSNSSRESSNDTKVAQIGSVVITGKEIQPPLIIMGTKNTRIGTYRFTVGAKEDVVFSDLKVTVRNLATFDFSKRATSLANMTFTVLGKTYPAIQVSEGVYSIYAIHFDNALILKKNTTVDAVLAADIGSGEGGSVDLWSNKGDFVFKGLNSSGVIVPTSSNSTNDNNFYWSGYLNVGKAMSSERLSAPSVLGASMTCVAITDNLHRGNETIETSKLQAFLKGFGYLDDSVTGFYGDNTIEAVKKYQRSKGLPETGMVYDFTRSAIKEDTCGGI